MLHDKRGLLLCSHEKVVHSIGVCDEVQEGVEADLRRLRKDIRQLHRSHRCRFRFGVGGHSGVHVGEHVVALRKVYIFSHLPMMLELGYVFPLMHLTDAQ